jgi:hypothetical protein
MNVRRDPSLVFTLCFSSALTNKTYTKLFAIFMKLTGKVKLFTFALICVQHKTYHHKNLIKETESTSAIHTHT